jgi:hypothetical protein
LIASPSIAKAQAQPKPPFASSSDLIKLLTADVARCRTAIVSVNPDKLRLSYQSGKLIEQARQLALRNAENADQSIGELASKESLAGSFQIVIRLQNLTSSMMLLEEYVGNVSTDLEKALLNARSPLENHLSQFILRVDRNLIMADTFIERSTTPKR